MAGRLGDVRTGFRPFSSVHFLLLTISNSGGCADSGLSSVAILLRPFASCADAMTPEKTLDGGPGGDHFFRHSIAGAGPFRFSGDA